VLLNQFWDENFTEIFRKILVPWAIFLLCDTWFFATVLIDGYDDHASLEEMIYKYVLASTISLLLIYQLRIEFIESSGSTIKEYFSTPTNWADMYTFPTTMLIIIC